MSSLKIPRQISFEVQWKGVLSEYVTVLTWSATGVIAACTAAGEVVLWQDQELNTLLPESGQSIDCLAFSADGQFLAAGGQDGKVRVWRMLPIPELIATLENAPQWIDRLSWCPTSNILAFSLGRYVQLWDAETQTLITTLAFESSSILSISWRPNGEYLAIAGNQGAKIWDTRNWDDDPYMMYMDAASIAIAWSTDGEYLASGNLDNTITVLKWGYPHPWVMRGFPGKIRQLVWSKPFNNQPPLLAASSVEGIAVWTKSIKDEEGWNAKVLTLHEGIVQGLAFQPNSLLLASAAEDGLLCLWQKAKEVGQILEDTTNGFSGVAWHPKGDLLAAGGQDGELMIWQQSLRGKGFGR